MIPPQKICFCARPGRGGTAEAQQRVRVLLWAGRGR